MTRTTTDADLPTQRAAEAAEPIADTKPAVTIGDATKAVISSTVVASGNINDVQIRRPWRFWRARKITILRRRLDAQLGEAPATIAKAIEVTIAECDWQAYRQRIASTRWGRLHFLLGAPAAVLAAIAAALAQSASTEKFVVSLCALAAAGLTTLVTFLKSDGNRDHSRTLSAGWSELADTARVCLLDYSAAIGRTTSDGHSKLHEKYSRIIVDLNVKKGRLLRGEIPRSRGQVRVADSG